MSNIQCTGCNSSISKTDVFCIYCGTKANAAPKKAQAPVAAKPVDTSTKKAHVKPAVAMGSCKCPNCGVALDDADAYCLICGFKKGDEAAASKPAAARVSKQTKKQPVVKMENKSQSSSSLRVSSSSSKSSVNRFSSLHGDDGSGHVGQLEKLWVPDSFSADCMDCGQAFGFSKARRHHCRVCGLLFCKKCVTDKCRVPPSFGYGSSLQRCCAHCNDLLNRAIVNSPADIFAMRKGGAPKVHPPVNTAQSRSSSEDLRRRSISDVLVTFHEDPAPQMVVNPNQPSSKGTKTKQKVVAENAAGLPSAGPAQQTQPKHKAPINSKDECQVCFRPFNNFNRRQHHCRRCTRSVCGSCSEGLGKPIPEFGFPNPTKHCKICMTNHVPSKPLDMSSSAAPPVGLEYLSHLELRLTLESKSAEQFTLNVFCDISAKQLRGEVGDKERAIVKAYGLSHTRTIDDFEWLHSTLSALRNAKALPFYVGRPNPKAPAIPDETRRISLKLYITACMNHPVLKDLDAVRAFCGLSAEEFAKFKKSNGALRTPEHLNEMSRWLRFKIQENHFAVKMKEFKNREMEFSNRQNAQRKRIQLQKKRESQQNQRKEQFSARMTTMKLRMAQQTERMEREKGRYLEQVNSKHIVFNDYLEDQHVRKEAIEQREIEKRQFQTSQQKFQQDTVDWNSDVGVWSLHRSDWCSISHPDKAKQMAHDWMLAQYGIFPLPTHMAKVVEQLGKTETPPFAHSEGVALDTEWTVLVEERQHWIHLQLSMKSEAQNWQEEDKRFQEELHHVAEERKCRQLKVEQVEKDIVVLEKDVFSREAAIVQRQQWHEELHNDYAAWSLVQSERAKRSHQRVEQCESRIDATKSRSAVLQTQLEKQRDNSRVLNFDRTAFSRDRDSDLQKHEQNKKLSKQVVNEANQEKQMLPEIITRLESDLTVRNAEVLVLTESNKCTHFEGTSLDKRDQYMTGVKTRRIKIQNKLDEQFAKLEAEETLTTNLIDKLNSHIAKLELEKDVSKQENEHVAHFEELITQENAIIQQESKIRTAKKQQLHQIINDSSEWVQETLLKHSKRKQKEADRLVEQAQRAAGLQRLVQRFTSRVIARESRVLTQKRRILGSEHRIDMLQSSDKWYQFITNKSSTMYQKDALELVGANTQRSKDITESLQLQAKDEENIGYVTQQLELSVVTTETILEKRNNWTHIENTYSMSTLTEDDEDMMFTSQIRGLLGQLDDSFSLLSARLGEEEDALRQASTQLEGEISSIQSFITRMESEEDTLTHSEQEILDKEGEILKIESQLIQTKSKSLSARYKKLQEEHAVLFDKMNRVKTSRNDRPMPASRQEEMDHMKRLVRSTHHTKGSRISFSKNFRVHSATGLSDVNDVVVFLLGSLQLSQREIKEWIERSELDLQKLLEIKTAFLSANWDTDLLTRIPAAAEVGQKMKNKVKLDAKEQWLGDLIVLKTLLSSNDKESLKQLEALTHAIGKENHQASQRLTETEDYYRIVRSTQHHLGIVNTSAESSSERTSSVDNSTSSSKGGSAASSSFISKYTSGSRAGPPVPPPTRAKKPISTKPVTASKAALDISFCDSLLANDVTSVDADDLGAVDENIRMSELDRHSNISIEM